MKRATILFPVLVAFVAGGVVGGRLLPAEAQRPAARPAASCETELKRARRQAVQAKERAVAAQDAAERAAELAQAMKAEAEAINRELERQLKLERERVKRLEKILGPRDIEDIDFR